MTENTNQQTPAVTQSAEQVAAAPATTTAPQQDANTARKKTAPQLIEVSIKRDFWDADGERHVAGTIVSVPIEAALEGIETGALARVKKGDK